MLLKLCPGCHSIVPACIGRHSLMPRLEAARDIKLCHNSRSTQGFVMLLAQLRFGHAYAWPLRILPMQYDGKPRKFTTQALQEQFRTWRCLIRNDQPRKLPKRSMGSSNVTPHFSSLKGFLLGGEMLECALYAGLGGAFSQGPVIMRVSEIGARDPPTLKKGD